MSTFEYEYEDVPENNGETEPVSGFQTERIQERVDVGNTGQLYRFNNADQDSPANEMGQAYARRQNMTDDMQRRRGSGIDTVLTLLGAIGSSMDAASAALAMPTPTVSRITHRITFKNDADIILIPGQINMPNRYYFSAGTTILYPGETCTCVETHQQNSHNLSQRMSFAFGAISTDSRFLPVDTNPGQADVFPFELWIGRNAAITTLIRVEGFVGNTQSIYGLNLNLLTTNVNTRRTLQYVGFRGRTGTTMPSFGIACVDVTIATQTPQTMATQITFTPLDLRI